MIELECLPYGVGHTDDGVCLQLRMGPHNILLDCGLRDLSTLLTDFNQSKGADFLLCSHAHEDHARGLLALHQAFPQLPIYASEVTTQLLPLNWPTIDPQEIPQFCQALPWRSSLDLQTGLKAELIPAGHLPGAAAFLLTYTAANQKSYTVLYTGDCFLSNSRLVEGFPLEEWRGLRPNVLIVEGSYGTARYPRRRQQENQLIDRISEAINQQRSILLPLPAIGLAQELLILLRSHHQFTGRKVDIWVDGNIARGCDIYSDLIPYFPSAIRNFAQHQPLFWDDRIRPHVYRLQTPAQLEQRDLEPVIVLTDSAADLHAYCADDPDSWLIMVPQLSRMRPSPVSGVPVETYLLAEHCDGAGTTQLIHNLRPQHVLFVHGPSNYLADLTSLDELYNRYHLHSPAVGTLVEMPIGDRFIQPAPPENLYEGSIEESNEILLTLSSEITVDPRWQKLADTGLIRARWQGEELVLRGLSQLELLSQRANPDIAPELRCCATCCHYRLQHCWNADSPLFEFKVTPDGYCPEFESLEPKP